MNAKPVGIAVEWDFPKTVQTGQHKMASIIYIYVHRFVKNDVVNHTSVESNLTFLSKWVWGTIFSKWKERHIMHSNVIKCLCNMNCSKFKKYLCWTMRRSGKGTMCPYSNSNVYVTWTLLYSRSICVEQWYAWEREQCVRVPSRTRSQQVCICLLYNYAYDFYYIHNVLSFSL